MTLSRYLRLWRELNAITIDDISNDLNINSYYIRLFDKTQNNDRIWEWYLNHGFDIEEYKKVNEKYQKKKENRKTKETTG